MASISKPRQITPFHATPLSFEDLKARDGAEPGFKAGQPYASLGITFLPAVVAATANLSSASGNVALRSGVIYAGGNQNFLGWQFTPAQRVFGFSYRSSRAQSVKVRALDSAWNLLEEASFAPGDGYAGILRVTADIGAVQVLAPHRSFQDADTARTYVDDLSFAREKKAQRKIRVPRGLPTFVLGGVRTDGGGIQIGPGGVDPVPPWTGQLQHLLTAARILADAESLPESAARTQLAASARSMMEKALQRLAKDRKGHG